MALALVYRIKHGGWDRCRALAQQPSFRLSTSIVFTTIIPLCPLAVVVDPRSIPLLNSAKAKASPNREKLSTSWISLYYDKGLDCLINHTSSRHVPYLASLSDGDEGVSDVGHHPCSSDPICRIQDRVICGRETGLGARQW